MRKSKAGTANRRGADSRRFEEVSKSSAQIVKDAAALLDEDLATGIQTAKQVQQRFRKQGCIDLPTSATRYNYFRPMPTK